MKRKRKIIISVTNDLIADNRVKKTAGSLKSFGFEPLLVGRLLPGSLPLNEPFSHKRFRLLFNKGFLFYACYNIRLFFFLLFQKADIFLANDLDSLPANYLAAKLRGKKLVYDSHEYFTEVPELINRKKVKRVWEEIERRILPKLKYTYTVCDSIAEIYNKKYGISMKVVRNIPPCKRAKVLDKKGNLPIPQGQKVVLYQGAVNIGRGLEYAIKAMQYTQDVCLLIIGNGDIKPELKNLVSELALEEKVFFMDKMPGNELAAYTRQADIGISIEENMGLNYYYALPNKLFDYIRAEVPVLVSPLPEMAAIVRKYDIGSCIENHSPEHIAEKITSMLHERTRYAEYKSNLKKAGSELCWENEEKVLEEIFAAL